MGAASKVDLLASHWPSLRESPRRVSAQARAQAREAWRVAATAYERSAQAALSHAEGDATAKPPAALLRSQHPG